LHSKFNIVWLTGMSGSGKSTLAESVKDVYQKDGYSVRIIDGDDIRDKDIKKLGFGRKDVEENNLRIAKLCLELKDDYNLIIVPVISPYEEIRRKVRIILEPYLHLIYVKADTATLKKRDTKGLYAAADKGIINNLIGYSKTNPYDKPNNAEITIDTGFNNPLEKSKNKLLDYIEEKICV